jgi:hypothetical protein
MEGMKNFLMAGWMIDLKHAGEICQALPQQHRWVCRTMHAIPRFRRSFYLFDDPDGFISNTCR